MVSRKSGVRGEEPRRKRWLSCGLMRSSNAIPFLKERKYLLSLKRPQHLGAVFLTNSPLFLPGTTYSGVFFLFLFYLYHIKLGYVGAYSCQYPMHFEHNPSHSPRTPSPSPRSPLAFSFLQKFFHPFSCHLYMILCIYIKPRAPKKRGNVMFVSLD